MTPQWALIAYLWFCYVLNHADRQVMYTLFPALQSEFALSDTVLGLTGALFLWIYGLCSPISGILGDRWPRTRVVTGSLILWSFFTLLTGFAFNGTSLLTLRALLGVSESLFMPAGYALIAAAHGPQTRSKAIAVFGTSQMFGVAIGGSVSGWLAENIHWRVAFWALGTIGILFALPLWRFFSRVPPSFLRGASEAAATFSSFLSLFRIPSLWVVTTFVSVGTFGLYLVYTWLPTYYHDRFSLGLARAGFEASVYPQIGTIFGLLVGGTLADKGYGRTAAARFWIVMAGFCFGGPSIFLLGQAGSLETARLASMSFGFFSGFIAGNQAAACFDIVPASQRASAVGVLNLLGSSVSGFAPFLGGMARRTIGVDRVMMITSSLYIITAAIILFGIVRLFRRDHERSLQTQSAVVAKD